MDIESACQKIKEKFGEKVTGHQNFRGEHTLKLEADAIHDVCSWAKEALGFDYFVDLCSIDHLGEDPRFEVVYELYSMKDGIHLRLKIPLSEDSPEALTVSDLWPTADWHERETFDMMGIRFKNHPDLRRILMWDGYPYYPLRKEFPLAGLPSEMPDVAFTGVAPLAGGPFVTAPTSGNTRVREPRARHPENLPPAQKFIEEP